MGIFDFFKKKQDKTEIKKVELRDLNGIIINKEEENKSKNEYFADSIKKIIDKFVKEIEEETGILENIDFAEKKIEKRTELIVKENLSHFIDYLRKLIKNLDNLKANEKSPENLPDEIKYILYNFNKKSIMSYEKSTFLIGKELERVKESIHNFLKSLDDILKNNSNILENSKTLYLIKKEKEGIDEITNIKAGIKSEINFTNQRIKNLKNANEIIKSNIEKTKNSEEYINEIRKNEEILKKAAILEEKISNIKMILDFKSLMNIFHTDRKKMEILKGYRNDFINSFQKKNGEELLEIVKEAGINFDKLSEKINDIIKEKENLFFLKKEKNEYYGDKIYDLELEIKKNNLEIENLGNELMRFEKKLKKMDEKMMEIIKLLKNNLMRINIELL